MYFARARMIETRSVSEGAKSFPRLRFGLRWDVPFLTARSITRDNRRRALSCSWQPPTAPSPARLPAEQSGFQRDEQRQKRAKCREKWNERNELWNEMTRNGTAFSTLESTKSGPPHVVPRAWRFSDQEPSRFNEPRRPGLVPSSRPRRRSSLPLCRNAASKSMVASRLIFPAGQSAGIWSASP